VRRPGPGDRLPLLTRRALLRAAAVAGLGGHLQPMLYRAGSVALGPRARRTHDDRWLAWLAASAARGVPGLLEGWVPHTTPHWQAWTRSDLVDGPARASLTAKTYVSPLPHALAATLPQVLRVVVELGVASVKVGCTAEGVLRPDKLVLHCADAAQADALAEVLAARLAGLPAQGVPFTGQADDTGLVSRGTDPPGTSWRAYVTAAAAGELRAAYASCPQAGPQALLAAAVDGLSRAGLDSRTWQPPRTLVPA